MIIWPGKLYNEQPRATGGGFAQTWGGSMVGAFGAQVGSQVDAKVNAAITSVSESKWTDASGAHIPLLNMAEAKSSQGGEQYE